MYAYIWLLSVAAVCAYNVLVHLSDCDACGKVINKCTSYVFPLPCVLQSFSYALLTSFLIGLPVVNTESHWCVPENQPIDHLYCPHMCHFIYPLHPSRGYLIPLLEMIGCFNRFILATLNITKRVQHNHVTFATQLDDYTTAPDNG